MKSNDILSKLPKHLSSFIVDQHYENYTARDHAVWRFVMRQNVNYLKHVAHSSYLDGLKKTGISTEKIPGIDQMNEILKNIGWAAVSVDGFIPPSAFMEFQANNVLVIAASIRQIDNIEYTPAPDIIHEAAGHAPIIADPEYAEYLKLFGEIGSKAFSSKEDHKIYEAVRHLSILKEDPKIAGKEINEAEESLAYLSENNQLISEMSEIRNLHWWTVEYGLIGDINNPEIYGAGLLSSIGESYNCLNNSVKKLPYNLLAKNYLFDITNQQPQLFVTPSFRNLTDVLLEFKKTMAISVGGIEGIKKSIDSGNIATNVFSSGIEVSGVFTEVITDKNNNPVYIKTTGPTSLNYKSKLLKGHNKDYHSDGFGSPVGLVKNSNIPLENQNLQALRKMGIGVDEKVNLEFVSGVKVEGILLSSLFKDDKLILLTFKDCLVKYDDKILFDPSWGIYDMAVGKSIISVFSGPSDPDAYGYEFEAPDEKTHKIEHNNEEKELYSLYSDIRELRESAAINAERITETWKKLKNHRNEWLLALEIYESAIQISNREICEEIKNHLYHLVNTKPHLNKVISDGLQLIDA